MHPSKIQQSTSKQPDTGLVLGFRPIQTDPKAPGGSRAPPIGTPSKGRPARTDQMEPRKFDFNFSSEDSQLSEEARKLMQNIRDDASRIKEQMVVEKDTQESKDGETEKPAGDRKIAKPKGKAGRFSQAHMSQFKNMDSIAGHASAFRTRLDREQPEVSSKSLKRTISKTRLDEPAPDEQNKAESAASATPETPTDTMVKRRKESNLEDTSSRRPLSKGDQCANRDDSKIARPTSQALSTPQKSTADSSASPKQHPNTTKIPAISRSPSVKSMQAPRTPQTDFNAKYQNATRIPGRPKSILRRRQPLLSDDPVKIAAGTHMAAPTADNNNASSSASARKHVDFSASTKLSEKNREVSPESPLDIVGNTAKSDVAYPTLPPTTPTKVSQETPFTFNVPNPTIRKLPFSEKPARNLPMVDHFAIPHGIVNKKRHREDADDNKPDPNDECEQEKDERSTKRVRITQAATPTKTRTPSPVKSRQLPQTTPRRGVAGSGPQKGGLTMSRLSFLSRPKGRR